ncbi:MAG: transcriptional repressor LexA [Planctomycetota bacterium]|nr:MAG: transcriptional repressor LexA [Planctomycetota bacterium]
MTLTPKQLAIVEFLVAYRDAHGLSPTLEEIARHFGVSKITVHEHVAQLCKKGAIRKKPYQSRSLTVNAELEHEVRHRVAHRLSGSTQPRARTAGGSAALPLLGRIAAGRPIEAVEDPEEVLDLADVVRIDRASYALKVCGDSMIEDGIHDGDYVIVENRNWANDGEVVVAIVGDNEATLKRLYREPDGRVRLQPANAALEPLIVSSCEIRGVVVGVLRRF